MSAAALTIPSGRHPMNVRLAWRCLRLILIAYLLLHGAFYLLVGCYVIIGSLQEPARLDLSGKPVGADFMCPCGKGA